MSFWIHYLYLLAAQAAEATCKEVENQLRKGKAITIKKSSMAILNNYITMRVTSSSIQTSY